MLDNIKVFLPRQLVRVSQSGRDTIPDGTKGRIVAHSSRGFVVEILEGEDKGLNMMFRGEELSEWEDEVKK